MLPVSETVSNLSGAIDAGDLQEGVVVLSCLVRLATHTCGPVRCLCMLGLI